MMTPQGLKEREKELKEQEVKLRSEWAAVAADRNAQREQMKITEKLRDTQAERVALGPKMAEVKAAAKREALENLLSDKDYRKGVLAAAEALGETLGPWLPLVAATLAAQRKGVAAPALPASIATLYVEGVAWLSIIVRRGILDAKDLPPALRSLVKEEGQ
jgi:hypothetical protein